MIRSNSLVGWASFLLICGSADMPRYLIADPMNRLQPFRAGVNRRARPNASWITCGSCSLITGARGGRRLTAAWAEAMGLASLSNVALLKRLRNSVDWLECLVCRLLGRWGARGLPGCGQGPTGPACRATSVAKAGRGARESGGGWRLDSVFDLSATVKNHMHSVLQELQVSRGGQAVARLRAPRLEA